jgi:uncharacterized protein (DUF58 family)
LTVPVPVLRPTTRGFAALGALVIVVTAAIVTGTPELAPLAVAIGVPLIIGPLLARRRARKAIDAAEIHAHVEPGTVEVGGSMKVRLSLTNRTSGSSVLPPLGMAPLLGQWRLRGIGVDRGARQSSVAPSLTSMLMLPRPGPRATESCLLDVPTGRRGVFELPPQPTWAHDPFGLFGASGPVTPDVLAAVHPVPVRPDQEILGIPVSVAGASTAWDPGVGNGLGELEGIRPYVAGDRLSLVHWPAKARYGTWFVRQFGAEGSAAVSIVLDDRAGVHRRAEFERLISAALWVMVDELRGDRVVRLVTLTGRSYVFEPDDTGRADVGLVLAELQPVARGISSRLPARPTDAVILTTRTGADRLMSRPTGPGPVEVTVDGADTSIRTSQIVVV